MDRNGFNAKIVKPIANALVMYLYLSDILPFRLSTHKYGYILVILR